MVVIGDRQLVQQLMLWAVGAAGGQGSRWPVGQQMASRADIRADIRTDSLWLTVSAADGECSEQLVLWAVGGGQSGRRQSVWKEVGR